MTVRRPARPAYGYMDWQVEFIDVHIKLLMLLAETVSAGFMDSKENKWESSQQSWGKEGTVRRCQSKEASSLA